MAGTREGGLAAAASNKAQYGDDFYKKIGQKGGSVNRQQSRYFYMNKDAARIAGAKGGRISRKEKKVEPDNEAIDERLWEIYVMKCEQRGVKAGIKDYLVWLEENYS